MVDSLQKIEEEVIDQLSLNKARMTLVDKDRSNILLDSMTNPTRAAGGSAANTAYWVAQLGGDVGFIGKISDDVIGKQFKESVKESGLKDYTVFESEDNQTGHCAIFITPDGERTMNTYLGAGAHLSIEDLDEKAIDSAEILYMEGYLWDRPTSKEAFLHAAKLNKLSGGKNAITLSDVFCVEMHRDSFIKFIKESIDFVFCNEEEIMALSKKETTDEAFAYFKLEFPNLEELVCTLGPDGAVVISKGQKVHYDATEAEVVDKTGAGDYFAAGYLYGLQKKLSIEESADIANRSAAHVISEVGVRPNKNFS
jgi:sugar/nucleoside kinase (ribokinase family)|tara:strand:+ start:2981 stop:3913 length:933 start_codon:yes stop_codon:yes gene_type:complete